jgi:hypothetical protein
MLRRYRRFRRNRTWQLRAQARSPRSWRRTRSIVSSPNKSAGITDTADGTGIMAGITTIGATIIGTTGIIITIGTITTGAITAGKISRTGSGC